MAKSAHSPHLANCEEAFKLSPIPIWVLDVDSFRVAWANAVALDFWHASSLEELAGREMLDKAPEPVLVRLRQTIARIRAGEVIEEDWTFVPANKPRVTILHLRSIVLRDGRLGMLNQAMKIEDAASESTVRSLAMVRHARATTVFVDDEGRILAQNAGAVVEFGASDSWIGWLEDPRAAQEIVQSALAGNIVEIEGNVRTSRGTRVHSILAHGLRDPVTGKIGILIQHFDVTERVEAERLVQTHLSRLREQQREILSLSTPFLDVGAKTLALPLIGRIDEQRASEITSRLLEMVANNGIQRVILDITGVNSVNSSSIAFIRRLVDAVVLLGAKPIVTGIRADLARELAVSDENLSGITIKRSLADGLAMWRSIRHDSAK
jgi:rsbT co-antagonist protein RsbR